MKFFTKKRDEALYTWAVLRISLGFIMLWAFVDKLFGMGYTTCLDAETGFNDFMCESAWLSGGSPTEGFLMHGTKGPFAGFFQVLAGNPVVDSIFMIGLLGIGIALILGIAVRLAGYLGAIMMLLMFVAALLPAHNPLVDEHIIYALVFAGIGYVDSGSIYGYSKQWRKSKLVKNNPWLQ